MYVYCMSLYVYSIVYTIIVGCQEMDYGILNYLQLEYKFNALQLEYATTRKFTDRIYFYIFLYYNLYHIYALNIHAA